MKTAKQLSAPEKAGLVVLGVWSLIWKGLALWRAAERKSVPWFVTFLFVNTAGVLDIIYLFAIAPRRKP
jgi:methionyl-tRNA synthetase